MNFEEEHKPYSDVIKMQKLKITFLTEKHQTKDETL